MTKNIFSSPRGHRTAWLAGLLMSAAVAAGAAATTLTTAPTTPSPIPEIAVRDRATQRWQALIAGRYEDAYDMLAPAVRAVQPLQAYRSSIGGDTTWVNAEVLRVNCNDVADKCIAVVRVETRVLFPGMSRGRRQTLRTHMDEVWIRQDDQWWFFPQP